MPPLVVRLSAGSNRDVNSSLIVSRDTTSALLDVAPDDLRGNMVALASLSTKIDAIPGRLEFHIPSRYPPRASGALKTVANVAALKLVRNYVNNRRQRGWSLSTLAQFRQCQSSSHWVAR